MECVPYKYRFLNWVRHLGLAPFESLMPLKTLQAKNLGLCFDAMKVKPVFHKIRSFQRVFIYLNVGYNFLFFHRNGFLILLKIFVLVFNMAHQLLFLIIYLNRIYLKM